MSSDFIRKEDIYAQRKPNKMKINRILSHVLPLQSKDLLRTDRSLLTTNQWTLLSNIVHAHGAYNSLSKLENIMNRLSIVEQDKFDPFKIWHSAYESTREFIRSTPDFQVLCINEQQNLLQRNLNTLSSFSATLFLRDTRLLDYEPYFRKLSAIYGIEVVEQVKYSIKYLDSDETISKLMILTMSFSSTCCLFANNQNLSEDNFTKGTYQLFASQNVYVELLWKYMIYRYGHFESIIRYSNFIKYMLDKIKQLTSVNENNKAHDKFVNETITKYKKSLVSDQNQIVPLWGKTYTSSG